MGEELLILVEFKLKSVKVAFVVYIACLHPRCFLQRIVLVFSPLPFPQEVTPLVSTGSSGDDAGFSGDRRSLEARALVAERAQRVKKTNSAGVTSGATSTSSASTSLGDSPQSPPSSPVSVSSIDGHTAARSEELDAYCALQSGREPLLLESLRLETMAKMPRAAHMVSGYLL